MPRQRTVTCAVVLLMAATACTHGVLTRPPIQLSNDGQKAVGIIFNKRIIPFPFEEGKLRRINRVYKNMDLLGQPQQGGGNTGTPATIVTVANSEGAAKKGK